MIQTDQILYSDQPHTGASAVAAALMALSGAQALSGATHRGHPSQPSAGRLRALCVRDPWSWHIAHYRAWLNPDGSPSDRLTAWGIVEHDDPIEQMRAGIRLLVRPDRNHRVHVGSWPGMVSAPADCRRLRCGLLSWVWRQATQATPARPMGLAEAVLDATRALPAVLALADHLGATLEDLPQTTTDSEDARALLGEDLSALIEKREAIVVSAWRMVSEAPRGLWLLSE